MDKDFTIAEIIQRFIGDIYPCGNSVLDAERYKNQELLIDVYIIITDLLKTNALHYISTEGDAEKIGKSALYYLKSINHQLSVFLENI